jgi:hypothetical protein
MGSDIDSTDAACHVHDDCYDAIHLTADRPPELSLCLQGGYVWYCGEYGGCLAGQDGNGVGGTQYIPPPAKLATLSAPNSGPSKQQLACAADVAINFGLGFIPGYNAAKLIGTAAGVNFNFVQNVVSGNSVVTIGPSPLSSLNAGASAYSLIRNTLFEDAGGAAQFTKLNSLTGSGWNAARTAINDLESAASSAGTIANLLNAASAAVDLYNCKDAK